MPISYAVGGGQPVRDQVNTLTIYTGKISSIKSHIQFKVNRSALLHLYNIKAIKGESSLTIMPPTTPCFIYYACRI